MVVTDFEFGGTVYQCRIVKDNSGDDLIIGSTAFLDALQPGSFEDKDEGFASREASDIYDEIFFFCSEDELHLPDEELISVLRKSNPEWF